MVELKWELYFKKQKISLILPLNTMETFFYYNT
ncbi:hypothetical protein CUP0502 [Campylobacter upsaliensis RM3195]|nr:hypothetical protein CUP0502 [Campylobacter upsaliensis RM3195]